MEDITDSDSAHSKSACKDFEVKNLGEYQDQYAQSDTLFLADVFENFTDMFSKIHELDPACFFTAPGFACQVPLKKTKIKLDLLTDTDILLMVEKGIRGGTNGRKRYQRRNMSLSSSICNR